MFKPSQAVWWICGIFSLFATTISLWLIWNHFRHFTEPRFQKPIIRILLMVPIYAIDSWLSLTWPNVAVYFDLFRDCYEAYVLYEFFVLLVQFCDGEDNLIDILVDKEDLAHPWPLCCLPKFTMGRGFFILCKRCVLQFVIVKPILAVITTILQATGVYNEGSFSFTSGYIYIIFIDNISITIALYFLVLFYLPISEELQPFRPIPKFICIKTIVFFAFWQGVIVSFMVAVGWIHEDQDWTVQNFSSYIQDSLICVEMFFIAIAHGYAFGYVQYKNAEVEPIFVELQKGGVGAIAPVIKNITETLSVKDVVNDTLDVFGREFLRGSNEQSPSSSSSSSSYNSEKNPHKIPKPGGSREEGYAFTKTNASYGTGSDSNDGL